MSSSYRKREKLKKQAYEQKIGEVECASFTPLVLSAIGGMEKEANSFYKGLASLLASKWDQPSWLQCHLTFSLFLSAIQCIRGAHSGCSCVLKRHPHMDLTRSESKLINVCWV